MIFNQCTQECVIFMRTYWNSNMNENGQKPPLTCDITHKKKGTQNQTFFFIADLKICRVIWGFE